MHVEKPTVEQWLPVVGFEGWYEVSNWGQVRRIKSGLGRTWRHHAS
jgi:hypothetical protein